MQGPLKASPVKRTIAGTLHRLHDVGPPLRDLLDGEPRPQWHILDRTAHEDHGDAPTVLEVLIVGKRRIWLIKQLSDRRQRARSIGPQPNERPTDGREHVFARGPGLNAHILLKNTHQLRYACFALICQTLDQAGRVQPQ